MKKVSLPEKQRARLGGPARVEGMPTIGVCRGKKGGVCSAWHLEETQAWTEKADASRRSVTTARLVCGS